jgi:hypothetical protein
VLQEEEKDGSHDNVQVVQTIHSVPQNGWLDSKNHIQINKLTILVQDDMRKWVPWSLPVSQDGSHGDVMLVMQ